MNSVYMFWNLRWEDANVFIPSSDNKQYTNIYAYST